MGNKPDYEVLTSVGLESQRILYPLLEPGMSYLNPDSYSFIALPLPPDVDPGTERERILSISRADTDRLGPQLARQFMSNLKKELEELEESGYTWRWVTVEATASSPPEVELFLRQRKVNIAAGEGLSLIAIGPRKANSPPPPKFPQLAPNSG